jgi:hypothetical protein
MTLRPGRIAGIIRRNLRNASMMGICLFARQDGLERDKKTHQVAWVGADGVTRGLLVRRPLIDNEPTTSSWICH